MSNDLISCIFGVVVVLVLYLFKLKLVSLKLNTADLFFRDELIILPETNIITAAIIYSLPIQMIAYELGVLLKKNIDQPRNLAKSVTVE